MAGSAINEPHLVSQESIADFLLHEEENEASGDCLRQRKTHVGSDLPG